MRKIKFFNSFRKINYGGKCEFITKKTVELEIGRRKARAATFCNTRDIDPRCGTKTTRFPTGEPLRNFFSQTISIVYGYNIIQPTILYLHV